MVVKNNKAIKRELVGQDFCGCPPCSDRQSIIYPATTSDMVKINGTGVNLESWLNVTAGGNTNTSLLEWLQHNWVTPPYSLPAATTNSLGGVIVDPTYLDINDGVLSVNINNLNIPSLQQASYLISGTVRLGNGTLLTSPFTETLIGGQQHESYSYSGHVYAFPLRLDSNGRAGIAIPTDLFASGGGSSETSKWTFDYSKKVTVVDTDVSPSGGAQTNYVLLGNKDLDTPNGDLGYDGANLLSTGHGYPRFALVAGSGITMTRYNNHFISAQDNYWGDNITELVISAPHTTYEAFIGADGTFPGSEGLVPAPQATDNVKFLRGDGTWAPIPLGLTYRVVNTLPVSDIDPMVIYLVPRQDTEQDDVFDEYMYINNTWELIGTTHVPVYTGGEGIDVSGTNISLKHATPTALGGIRTGYPSDSVKKAVKIVTDSNDPNYLKAYVEVEVNPSVPGVANSSGLSSHYFRYGTAAAQGSYTPDTWMPLMKVESVSGDKFSTIFEIVGGDTGKTFYGKYYINCHGSATLMDVWTPTCLEFYTEDEDYFDLWDVVCTAYHDGTSWTFFVYKNVRNVTDSAFTVNILSENPSDICTSHYFYTGNNSSIAEPGYSLTSSDYRIGTLTTNPWKMTARYDNDPLAPIIVADALPPENSTFYNTFRVDI